MPKTDPYPPVSEEVRDYTEALMNIAAQNSGVVEEFLSFTDDPEWECKAYYSTTRLTAILRPAKVGIWHAVESRLTPEQFVALVLVARQCNMTVRQAIMARLAMLAYNVK